MNDESTIAKTDSNDSPEGGNALDDPRAASAGGSTSDEVHREGPVEGRGGIDLRLIVLLAVLAPFVIAMVLGLLDRFKSAQDEVLSEGVAIPGDSPADVA
jgi:hypothetical protein